MAATSSNRSLRGEICLWLRRPKLTYMSRSYAEEEVAEFLVKFDKVNFERIRRGLKEAEEILEALPKEERGIKALTSSSRASLYAIFETLNSDAVLENETFLKNHFDKPFLLVQENRRLRLNRYPPAIGYFLFQRHPERNFWAHLFCQKFKRNLTAVEFQWSVQEPFSRAMKRVQLSDLEMSFLPTFWSAVKTIVSRLDADLVTHSLRAADRDVCKIALDHLQVDDSDSFKSLLQAMQLVLGLSPKDFWNAMGATPASVWIDQFAQSMAFRRCLGAVNQGIDDTNTLDQIFGWLIPFVSTIRPVQQARVCNTLSDILFHKLQTHEFSDTIKDYCQALGFRVLATTLNAMTVEQISANTRSAISEVLDLVQAMAPTMISLARNAHSLSEPCAELLSQALALEVQCLEDDRDYISNASTPPGDGYVVHKSLWESCCRTLSADNMLMAKFLIMGCKGLVGLEKFIVLRQTPISPKQDKFNDKLDALNNHVADMLERMNDFNAESLQLLFEEEDVLNAFIMQLLSSDSGVRLAVVDVVKTTSGQTTQREAFTDALNTYLNGVMNAFSLGLRRIGWKCTFAPASTTLGLCREVLDILCNSSKGLLRVATMSAKSIDAVERFWEALWDELSTIFSSTEDWSKLGHDKEKLQGFCEDVMEFAGTVFHEFPVFAGALSSSGEHRPEDRSAGQRLVQHPQSAMPGIIKFLRLRSEYLNTKCAELVCDMLRRLKQYDSVIEEGTAEGVENVITGKIRTLLSDTHKAGLHRALEENLGKPVAFEEQSTKAEPTKKTRPATIDLEKWRSQVGDQKPASSQSVIDSITKGSTAYKQRVATQAPKKTASAGAAVSKNEAKSDPTAFARKRQEELAAKKKRDAEAVARAKAKMGGSGLAGIGVAGKDHVTPKGEGMMVSDDDSEDDDSMDDMDKELFGDSTKPTISAAEKAKKEHEKNKKKQHLSQPQGPVKKQRLVRSAKDMRARLAPDLTTLHKHILEWNPNHGGAYPPGASQKDYATVLRSFRDPMEYQNTFQPLLLLEAWNGFLKAKEENQSRPVEMKIITRSSVDAFSEISASMDQKEFKDIVEGDIVLIAKTRANLSDDREPKCLSRVMKIVRKKTHVEFLYRVVPSGPLASALNPQNTACFLKIMPIVPLEREYGALLGLQYYDLCEEITQAKPSPLLPYRDDTLAPYIKNYSVNEAQAKAIKSALDNDAFTLIQGPPGSGKTKTIVAIIGALLTSSLQRGGTTINQLGGGGMHPQARPPSKKMLVCAPSNAAVDELVMRFKEGVKLTDGSTRPLSVVRLGRSDAVNANVQDVTLDELVDKRLNIVSEGQAREETTKLMREHQEISQKLREARARNDESDTSETRGNVEDLKKAKAQLNQKVEMAKTNEGQASRQAELSRRKVQQEVIEEAHVICATLSGSGHDMFQNLNVEFETVVIDEAAQCVELSALIPLKYGCAKCVLVGDPQQLPPTVFSREAANYKYEQSLFVRMQSNHPKAVHLLDTQYRMHPSISKFPSSAFYEGRLRDGPDMGKLRTRPWHAAEITGPFRFFDVQGQHQSAPTGHSLVNLAEIRVAMLLYRRLLSDFKVDFQRKVGIITPYKSQLRELKSRFSQEFGGHITRDVEFNTTDAFQGRESEIIIFSCVRASPAGGIGFLQDIRRMNVGLTRAKSSLWVLGNSQSLVKGEYWRKLVEHAQSSGHLTTGNIELVLSKPLKKIKDLEAAPEGDKMPEMDAGGSSGGDDDDNARASAKKDFDPMDLDEERKPSRMVKSDNKAEHRRGVETKDTAAGLRERKPQPAEGGSMKGQRGRPSPSPSSSDASIPAKRKTSEHQGLAKKARSESADVDMKDVSWSEKGEKTPSRTENGSAGGSGKALAAARPNGVANRQPPMKKKQAPSVFMPANRRG